jgi:hypothetical protein
MNITCFKKISGVRQKYIEDGFNVVELTLPQ